MTTTVCLPWSTSHSQRRSHRHCRSVVVAFECGCLVLQYLKVEGMRFIYGLCSVINQSDWRKGMDQELEPGETILKIRPLADLSPLWFVKCDYFFLSCLVVGAVSHGFSSAI